MRRVGQSLLGVLIGVAVAVVAAVGILVVVGGPGEPAMTPNPDAGAGGPDEPDMTPAPDDGGSGPVEPEPSPEPQGQWAVGYVVADGSHVGVHEDASTGSQVIATLDDGAVVYITCTTRGEIVSSSLTGSSDLWNYTTLGGYVPDVFVDTGTNEPVKPECPG